MIKMRAPDGLTGFSHQGYPIEIGADGAAHVDARHAGDLEAHGFVPWDQPQGESPGVAIAKHQALDEKRQRLVALFADTLAALSDEEVERMAHDAEDRQRMEREDAERLDASTVTAADIDHMKRHELFAFLKKRGIPAVPPIDNHALRAKARAALAA